MIGAITLLDETIDALFAHVGFPEFARRLHGPLGSIWNQLGTVLRFPATTPDESEA